jgi:hypothetical protein
VDALITWNGAKMTMSRREMLRVGVGTSAAILLRDLLQDALDDGGSDNITLIVCRTVRNDS